MNTRNLDEIVEIIKSSASSGIPPSESFREVITKRDRTRCIAKIALEGLWNGEGPCGWVAPKSFWDMVTFIWHNAPEFFVADDSGRMINEDSKVWDQRYLDVQRNYLRHNFSLRRLCHLVMVYEYLHDKDASDRRREDKREPSNVPSQTAARMAPRSKFGRGSLARIMPFASLIILVGVSMYCLGRRNGGDGRTSSATNSASKIIIADDSDKEYARVPSATNVVRAIAKADDSDKKSPRIPAKETPPPKTVDTVLAQQKTNGVESIVVFQERAHKVKNPPVKRTIKDNAK